MTKTFSKERQEKLDSMFIDVRQLEYGKLIKSLKKFSNIREDLKIFIDSHLANFKNFNFGENILDKYYEAHLFRVTRFVAENISQENKNAENCLKVAFLHNAIEKSYISENILEKETNLWVSNAIKALTQNRKEINNPVYLENYYTHIISMPKEVMIVKICDKFDNVLAQCLKKDDKKRMKYFNEIELYIMPYLTQFTPKLARIFPAMLKESIQVGYIEKSF